jgi:hypothetical protein
MSYIDYYEFPPFLTNHRYLWLDKLKIKYYSSSIWAAFTRPPLKFIDICGMPKKVPRGVFLRLHKLNKRIE